MKKVFAGVAYSTKAQVLRQQQSRWESVRDAENSAETKESRLVAEVRGGGKPRGEGWGWGGGGKSRVPVVAVRYEQL